MTEGVLASNGVEPVLVPNGLSVGTHLTSSWVDDVAPSVVLEWVVELATQLTAKACAGNSLGVFPCIAIVEVSLVAQCLIGELYKLLLVNHVVALGSTVAPAHGRAPGHVGATLNTLLGLDHDDTIGTTSTIQCTCRGIFQDGHRLDIVRVDIADAAIERNTINNIEWVVVGVDRAETTDADYRSSTWLT